jgi:spermidine/putrescine transport system permease protein
MRARKLVLIGYVTLVMAFLLLPVLVIIAFSFNDARSLSLPIEGLSLQWYREAFASPRFTRALQNSLTIGAVTLAGIAIIGTPAAWAIGRYRFRGRGALLAALVMPLTLPGLFIGVALLTYFVSVDVRPSLQTVVVAHMIYTLGFYVLVASSRFAGLDPALDEAARTLGAGRLASLRLITWPLVRPALLGALALCFALSLDEFIITFYVIGPDSTLPIVIFANVRTTVSPVINAIATMLLLASWLSVAFATVVIGGRGKKRPAQLSDMVTTT